MTARRESDFRRVAGVVFDLDGTLVDGFQGIATAVNAVRAGLGLSSLPTHEVTRHVGRGLDDLLASLIPPEHLEGAAENFRAAYGEVALRETHAVPGAHAALERLARDGVRLSVASNKLARFARPILETLDLERFFDAVHGPDTAGRPKPHPAMIHACLSAMGVDASSALYVGDMPLDIEAADASGVSIVLVAGGAAPREALEATGVPVVDGLLDLAARMQRAD